MLPARAHLHNLLYTTVKAYPAEGCSPPTYTPRAAPALLCKDWPTGCPLRQGVAEKAHSLWGGRGDQPPPPCLTVRDRYQSVHGEPLMQGLEKAPVYSLPVPSPVLIHLRPFALSCHTLLITDLQILVIIICRWSGRLLWLCHCPFGHRPRLNSFLLLWSWHILLRSLGVVCGCLR